MGLMVDHSIASAVEQMYTIARKISRRDPALAKKIKECAKELNKHPGWNEVLDRANKMPGSKVKKI